MQSVVTSIFPQFFWQPFLPQLFIFFVQGITFQLIVTRLCTKGQTLYGKLMQIIRKEEYSKIIERPFCYFSIETCVVTPH